MYRMCLAALSLILSAAPATANLEIQDIQAVHGQFGPQRKALDFYPYDEVVFHFRVVGAKVKADGTLDAELTKRLIAPGGKVVIEEKFPLKDRVYDLGGEAFAAFVNFWLGAEHKPGEYTLNITLRDHLGDEAVSFERKLTLKAEEFAIVSPRFFHDPEGRVPASAGGRPGQTLTFRLVGIGVDRSQGKVDCTLDVQVLDAAGKEVIARPGQTGVKNDKADEVKKWKFVHFFGGIALNRPGDFTLRFTVTDNVSNKTATFETAIKVTGP